MLILALSSEPLLWIVSLHHKQGLSPAATNSNPSQFVSVSSSQSFWPWTYIYIFSIIKNKLLRIPKKVHCIFEKYLFLLLHFSFFFLHVSCYLREGGGAMGGRVGEERKRRGGGRRDKQVMEGCLATRWPWERRLRSRWSWEHLHHHHLERKRREQRGVFTSLLDEFRLFIENHEKWKSIYLFWILGPFHGALLHRRTDEQHCNSSCWLLIRVTLRVTTTFSRKFEVNFWNAAKVKNKTCTQ